MVKYLVEKGANLEAQDQFNKTPLYLACYNNNIDIVKYLVEKGANLEAKD